jgi:hypothetical protein
MAMMMVVGVIGVVMPVIVAMMVVTIVMMVVPMMMITEMRAMGLTVVNPPSPEASRIEVLRELWTR